MFVYYLRQKQIWMKLTIIMNNQVPGLGAEFLDDILSTFKRITSNPTAWAPFSQRTHRCLTTRFPYGVIYQIVDDTILIIAIANLHRRPGYWKDRIKK